MEDNKIFDEVTLEEVTVDDSTDVAEVSEGGVNGGAIALVGLAGAVVVGGAIAGYKKFIAPKFTPEAKIARLEAKIAKQEEKLAKAEEKEAEDSDEVTHDKKSGFIKIPRFNKNNESEEE